MLTGKTVLLGVTGGIAAYKAADLVSRLVKLNANVEIIMTKHATEFITPLTLEQLSGNRVVFDMFDRNFVFQTEHIALARRADLVMIAPATANVCAKLAHGIADDMLTTTILACRCPKIIAPAMNTAMWENPVTQDNLEILRRYHWEIIPPDSGRLACGDIGAGKLPDPEVLTRYILKSIAFSHDLTGKKFLITAGPTREPLDPVRFITNHSTGKMGYALANMAILRGADVKLISGPTQIAPPMFADVIYIHTAQEMFETVKKYYQDADFIFKAAAVADYTPEFYHEEKVKKSNQELNIPLKRTQDILRWLGENKKAGQIICGFSMETENMIENSLKKLKSKRIDMICANNLKTPGAGFGTDTNIITLIDKNGVTEELPLQSKEAAAMKIIDHAAAMIQAEN